MDQVTKARAYAAMSDEERNVLRKAAIAEGTRMSMKFFNDRGGDPKNRVEVHIDRTELASLLVVAFEFGYETRAAKQEVE